MSVFGWEETECFEEKMRRTLDVHRAYGLEEAKRELISSSSLEEERGTKEDDDVNDPSFVVGDER